jgi:hypothetical protein
MSFPAPQEPSLVAYASVPQQTRWRKRSVFMGSRCQCRVLLVCALLLLLTSVLGFSKDKRPTSKYPTVTWREGDGECTLSKGDDGIYRYALGFETLHVTMAIDSQELEKTRRNLEHVFIVLLTFRNRGTVPIKINMEGISLELVDHYRVRMSSADPDRLSARIQGDTEELEHQTERELKNHPERKSAVEARLQEHTKLVSEWQDYLSAKTLRDTVLDSGQPETSGLVLFNTRTKWKGDWKKEENFVLRIPLQNVAIEFPFRLPPTDEGPELRKRQSE